MRSNQGHMELSQGVRMALGRDMFILGLEIDGDGCF